MVDINKVKTFSIIGAGHMGHEIAEVFLIAGFETVILNDLTMELIDAAIPKIKSGLKKFETKGKLTQNVSAEQLMNRLIKEVDLKEAVKKADFVVEAIPEKMELKQSLFRKLSQYAPEHAILATNTSTMSITKIAESCARPDKVVGMHFFTPIPVLRLIEVIKGQKTSEETMETTIAVGKVLPALKGKKYLARIEKESPGFIVNRLTIAGSAYLNWLLDYAMENGIAFEEIDADVGTLQELGPFSKLDYLGLDTVYNTLKYFENVLSSDFAPGIALTNLVKEGNLGRKTGKGFFEWTHDGKLKIEKKKKAGLFNAELSMALQLNEGCRLLEEGIVNNYKTIDDTMLAGMDMPGPFGAGKKNYLKWCELLEDFVQKSGKLYFRPCNLMKCGGFLEMKK